MMQTSKIVLVVFVTALLSLKGAVPTVEASVETVEATVPIVEAPVANVEATVPAVETTVPTVETTVFSNATNETQSASGGSSNKHCPVVQFGVKKMSIPILLMLTSLATVAQAATAV